MSAVDAARLLGVSRATLYAYVSRGLVRSQATAGASRERAYARDDLERLRRRTEARRAPDKAAARALHWGMPILESSISCIDGQALYYRGLNAVTLARSRSLEEIASLVWTGTLDTVTPPASGRRTVPARPRLPFIACAQAMLAATAARDPLAPDLRPANVILTGRHVLRVLTHAATRADTGTMPIHEALAREWRVPARGTDLLRAALVLCADHELNVSSFTARCVASANGHPYGVVIAGLAALEGPQHGGASARAESLLDALRRARSIREAVADRLRRGEPLDGFGHPLYPDGDPRATLLLAMAGERYRAAAEYRYVAAFARAVAAMTGERPNLDFGLAAVGRVLGLPAGAALTLFAIGRSVGWIGHALEQYATAQLIRPRAKYVGVPPAAVGRV